MSSIVRRLVPYTLLPLGIIGTGLASSPWLRAFPYAVIDVPLFGAAVLSVLVPIVVFGIGLRRLWMTAIVDVALFAFYELLVTLRAPGGFDQLYTGLVHGPAQILTYALPLVSPRTLLVAPVALCWLSGALIGETIARGWMSVLPYVSLLGVFGLSYAATTRAITSSDDGHRYDTLFAVGLLLVLLLLRTAQTWVEQSESARITQADGVLPLRGLVIGLGLAVVTALAIAGIAQTAAFTGPPTTPNRQPPLNLSKPLTPLSFVSGLRPDNPKDKGKLLFTVSTDSTAPNYISLASVDNYDGDGWSFAPGRTFRPTGGVIPADNDPALRTIGPDVTQQYTMAPGPLTQSPWMPYIFRPARVIGVPVELDENSGMVVPNDRLGPHTTYTMRSSVATTPLSKLRNPTVGSYDQTDQQRPASITTALGSLVDSLRVETNTTTTSSVITFLQAVARDFQTKYNLAGDVTKSSSASPAPAAGLTPSPGSPAQRSGGTSFADVLASIRQFRSATPEQYATLMCLIARQVGVPARVTTGFRIGQSSNMRALPPGTYRITSGDAWTWVEIPVAGQGWVVLDPSPSVYTSARPLPSAAAPSSASLSASATPNAHITQANSGRAVAPKSKVSSARRLTAVSLTAIIVVCVAIALIGMLLFFVLRKLLRRRRRRRADDPRRRLLGAWQESLDLLQESGLPDLSGYTSREVSEATHARFGNEPGDAVRSLGTAANAAIFSQEMHIGHSDAEHAWHTHVVLRRGVRQQQSLRERVRSQLRYHRGKSQRPAPGPSSWSAPERLDRVPMSRSRHIRGGSHR